MVDKEAHRNMHNFFCVHKEGDINLKYQDYKSSSLSWIIYRRNFLSNILYSLDLDRSSSLVWPLNQKLFTK